MAPGVMVTVSKSEKILWVHGGKTEDNFICEDRQDRRLTNKLSRLSLASLSG